MGHPFGSTRTLHRSLLDSSVYDSAPEESKEFAPGVSCGRVRPVGESGTENPTFTPPLRR